MTSKIFESLRAQALQNRFENASARIKRLKKLQTWIQQNEKQIEQALFADFKKPDFEVQISEIIFSLGELKYFISHLSCWMKDKCVKTPLSLLGHSSRLHFENKGVVLIISPWNYPFLLTVTPLIAAIAAGNTVIIKPSELTKHTSDLLQRMCTECFLPTQVVLEQGDKDKTTELLTYSLGHVFFTGSTPVGKIIAKACAEQLIPCTLELGGKSPVIIDETADISETARKIYWGKFLNRGQTCVAPDAIYIHRKVKNEFMKAYSDYADSLRNETASQIITPKHAERLKDLTHQQLNLSSMNTFLLDLDQNKQGFEKIQTEEIFGPVATIESFENLTDIQAHYNKSPNPLALYVFSKNQNFIDQTLRTFPSGGVGVNTIAVHLANHHLPFGGVGTSGQGRYHGYYGFLEFSHQRAVLTQKRFNFVLELLFPPYTEGKKKLMTLMKKIVT